MRNIGMGLGACLAFALACADGAVIVRVPVGEEPEPRLPDQQHGGDASWVFDEDAVREYQLVLAPADWEALQATALEESYFPAQLSVDGAPFGQVGLRFKGSRGTLRRCADRAGNLLCRKLSMKISFDEYEGAQRFFGLKRLNFNSMLSDASELHERLAYKLFREMGVIAPRAVHARLQVNGETLGVFSLVEQIDGRFTDDRFEGGDGNLYKEQWPITGSSRALDATLETNEEAPDHSVLARFSSELAAADQDSLVELVSRYMDIDGLLAFLAVDRVISNWDGFSTFYCRGGGRYNHNYYLYQHEHESRFSVIPWDLDNTFRVWTPHDHLPMPLSRPDSCSTRYPIFSTQAKAPACDPIFGALALVDRERYRSTVARLLAGPFDLARLDAWLDARVEQLSPYVAKDPNAPTLAYFLVYVEALRADLRFLGERIRAEQDGEPLARFRLALDGVNDFETVTPLGLRLGTDAFTAGGSRVSATVGDRDALDGLQDLLVSFDFPASDREERWARMRVLLAGDFVDLSAKTGVRLEIQSDAPRRARIGIDSDRYALFESRAVFGWDVELDGSRQTLELSLAEANYPEWGVDTLTLAEALGTSTALLIEPRVVESENQSRGSGSDSGQIRVDRISFMP
jgi:hypothetical protein